MNPKLDSGVCDHHHLYDHVHDYPDHCHDDHDHLDCDRYHDYLLVCSVDLVCWVYLNFSVV